MSNITVTHADSGAMRAAVVASTRVSPNIQRVTLRGEDLDRLHWQGFDQWVRLALPANGEVGLDRVPERFTTNSYLKMMAAPAHRRPVIRNYTLRQWRPQTRELDIDFVLHGTHGIAGPWATTAATGAPVAMIDQGCGWSFPASRWHLLVADETGLPAVCGVLRDLSSTDRGIALIELGDLEDAQRGPAPEGVEVRWLLREPDQKPGEAALAELNCVELPDRDRHAFAVGESGLATGVRRHLLRQRGWAKGEVTFCGYWKR